MVSFPSSLVPALHGVCFHLEIFCDLVLGAFFYFWYCCLERRKVGEEAVGKMHGL